MNYIFGVLGAWIASALAIIGLFPVLDRHLREEYRLSLAKWIKGNSDHTAGWPKVFLSYFDTLYKVDSEEEKILFRLSFLRVALTTIFAIFVAFCFWVSLIPPEYSLSILEEKGYPPNAILPFDLVLKTSSFEEFRFALEIAIMWPLLLNFLPDYISLVETRYILVKLSNASNRAIRILWILADLLFTLTIAFLAYTIFNVIMAYFHPAGSADFAYWAKIFWPTFTLSPDPLHNYDAPFIYSTFLTSIWLVLFLVGSLALKALFFVPYAMGIFNRFFRLDQYIDNKPLTVIGCFLVLLMTATSIFIYGWSAKA